jgi:hypothetical protein
MLNNPAKSTQMQVLKKDGLLLQNFLDYAQKTRFISTKPWLFIGLNRHLLPHTPSNACARPLAGASYQQ